jgi:hypothetical protein
MLISLATSILEKPGRTCGRTYGSDGVERAAYLGCVHPNYVNLVIAKQFLQENDPSQRIIIIDSSFSSKESNIFYIHIARFVSMALALERL